MEYSIKDSTKGSTQYSKASSNEKKNKLLIAIDGNSLMHRAYYALPFMTAGSGEPTGAIYGFLNMLLKLLEYEPDYLVAAFDTHEPTFRHVQFDEYKAGRRDTPNELRSQFPLLYEILNKMGILVCTCPTFEADDIMGTFAGMAERAGIEALLVTGDKDALQLISGSTNVLLTKKGISETVRMDEQALMAAYGLKPERMKDLKGLMGDNSDNIPGIPGIGEKTALKLLHEFESMDGVLANGANIPGKLGAKVREYPDLAKLSYELGTIIKDAPIKNSLEDAKFSPERMEDGSDILLKYQLVSIEKRINKSNQQKAPVLAADVTQTQIQSYDELKEVAQKLKEAEYLAFVAQGDTMTFTKGDSSEYKVTLSGTLLEPGLSIQGVIEELKPLFVDEGIKKIFFDAKRFRHMLWREGVELRGLHFDAMIADYLVNAGRSATAFYDLAMKHDCPAGAMGLFAIYELMSAELKNQGLSDLFENVEMPLIEVLFDMEREGFLVDPEVLGALGQSYALRLDELERQIHTLAGEPFNILSPKQLSTVLFEKLGLPAQRKTKTGYSTDAEVLEKLSDMHPIIKLLQEYRLISKLKSNFIDGLLSAISHVDKRVHTSFNQNVTATGRISSTEPNLQNIPVRSATGREIRKGFVASEGNVLVGADYSQIELRLLAHISEDERMTQAFLHGGDIHARTASEVFGVPLSEVTPEQRSAAKAVNFGIVYGISDFGLAKNLNISKKKAGEYIERYFERYSGLREYMHQSVEQSKREGYASTILGRKRKLSELNDKQHSTRAFGERAAMNMPIQGSAADIIKLAMVNIHRALKNESLKAKLILQVHDELIIDSPIEEAQRVGELLKRCMQDVVKLKVPLIADVKTGKSWYDTK